MTSIQSSERLSLVPIVLYVLGLNIDSITTYFVIDASHLIELNPVVQYAYGSAGLAGIFGWKIAITALGLALLSRDIAQHENGLSSYAVLLAGCGIIWSIAGIWNLFILSP